MIMKRIYRHYYQRVRDIGNPFSILTKVISLPPWMHLTIDCEGDTKTLTVHSRIHKNKNVKMNPVYSSEFTDIEIIKDLSNKIYSRFIA